MRNKKGFTLVEIMIVVAIIALLAAIAIPNLLRARLSANDALAQSTLRSISTGAESYATANAGNYPSDITAMVNATPPFLNSNVCDQAVSGYDYTCSLSVAGYTVTASPVALGTTGTTTFTISTGGVLVPN